MHDGTVIRGDRKTEPSCDRFCGRKIRQCFTPLLYIILCSFVVEIFTAACWQKREGNARLETAMFTKKITERRDNECVGRRLGVDDARVHLPAHPLKNSPNVNGTTHKTSKRQICYY